MHVRVGTILLADSDEGSRASLADVLAADGHEVVLAASARSAVAAVRRYAIDVAVLAADLRDVPGHRLAPILRDLSPDLPVVVTTHTPSEIEEGEARRIPVIYYGVLPGDLQFIPGVIRQAMHARSRLTLA